MQSSRDRDCLNAAAALLVASNEFDAVALDTSIEQLREPSGDRAVALLERTGWVEENHAGSNVVLIRTVTFKCTVALRMADEIDRFEAIERLENIARAAINGQSLAGETFRDKTFLSSGTDDKSRHPESRSVMTGQFVYLLEGYADANTSP